MKLIFLDIDGVMNSRLGHGPYQADMEEHKLCLLHDLCLASNAKVVLSSDRRELPLYVKAFLEATKRFGIPVIGTTRLSLPYDECPDDGKGKQILDYLTESEEDIESLVIFDDQDEGISALFPDQFVSVNRFYGLTEELCQKALGILK